MATAKSNVTPAKPVVPAAPVAAAPQPEKRYVVIAPKRPLTGTKHGKGTASTHGKLAELAKSKGGTLTFAEAQALCKELGDPGFARYALNRLKVLVPQQAS